jgi:transcriptional regulator with PAS, ATPase and Fis domain
MVTVNCGTIPKELATSELFGSVKGAFTDAKDKKGFIEAADGGILFLDEFNSLPLDAQVNLLRFIEYKTFIKVGDNKERTADVRIIAASNKSCVELVEKDELREDLYGRFPKVIYIPTLKERIEDFDYFVDHFINEENENQGKTAIISSKTKKMLAGYGWPRNIRQLKNIIMILVIEVEPDEQSKKCVITPQLVRECFKECRINCFTDTYQDDNIQENDHTLRTAHANATKESITKALIETGGNIRKAAKLLGISPTTFYKYKNIFEIK